MRALLATLFILLVITPTQASGVSLAGVIGPLVNKTHDIACRRIQAALDAPDMFIEAPKPTKQEALL